MSHKQHLMVAVASVIALAHSLNAQTVMSADSAKVDLCDHISASGRIVLSMPDKLRERMQPEEQQAAVQTTETQHSKPVAGRTAGYRIQVFSDNNSRTAKGEARTRARNISAQFTDYQTYVVYS